MKRSLREPAAEPTGQTGVGRVSPERVFLRVGFPEDVEADNWKTEEE